MERLRPLGSRNGEEEVQCERGSVNTDTTDVVEERDKHSGLQEIREEPTPGGSRVILKHNTDTFCVCVEKNRHFYMFTETEIKYAELLNMIVLHIL